MKKYFLLLLVSSALSLSAQDNLEEADKKIDGAFEKVTLKEREIIPYDHLREADVKWTKRVWRVIDFKEKINLPFAHPKMGLVSILHNAAKNGEIQVYNISEKGETFQDPMNVQDVSKIGVTNDTTTRTNIETGIEERVAFSTEFDPAKVTKLRIKEEWLFDIETSTLLVRILGMTFIMDKYSESGDLQGELPLYWIYYPDVRRILAQNQVYNIKNDVNTTSWEDIFEFRYFNSYIIKESHANPFDRKIQDYATGLDLLYESDKIHNEIRNYESDLWEY